jgi:hypothetical protein
MLDQSEAHIRSLQLFGRVGLNPMFGPLGLTDDSAARIEPRRCGAKQPRRTFRPPPRHRQPHEHIRVVAAERARQRCP